MTIDLFDRQPLPARALERKEHGVYQTPTWAAEALVDRYYGNLTSSDRVVEPSCGEGHFLEAIPAEVPAVGIELNPELAAIARRRTGRDIVIGDVLDVELPHQPSLVVGNPPFRSELIDALLERVWHWLPYEGRCGLILPAFVMGKGPRVSRLAEQWSIVGESLPRDLFPGPRMPIQFVRFEKRRERVLVGYALFDEAAWVRALPRRIRHMLTFGRAPAWKAVVLEALRECGGQASLEDVYRVVAGRRPSKNQHWKPKVQQVLHHYAERVGPSLYRIGGA